MYKVFQGIVSFNISILFLVLLRNFLILYFFHIKWQIAGNILIVKKHLSITCFEFDRSGTYR